MRTVEKAAGKAVQKSAVGCGELGRMGLIKTSRCCERCHSADEYAPVGSLGPCHATLPDGREVLVCCSGKKQLLWRGAL